MTTLENSTIGDDTVAERRRDGKRPPWMEKPNPVTQVVKFVALAISVALVIIPFWSVIATSIADQETINASGGGMVMWPTGVTFSAYQAVLSGGVVTRAVLISDRHHRDRDLAVAGRHRGTGVLALPAECPCGEAGADAGAGCGAVLPGTDPDLSGGQAVRPDRLATGR